MTGLKPHTMYNVVVEARKMQKYRETESRDLGADDNYANTFILTAQTDKITLQTASPPSAPSNVGIVSTTCNSIQVGWDAPRERGAEVIGQYLQLLNFVVWFRVFFSVLFVNITFSRCSLFSWWKPEVLHHRRRDEIMFTDTNHSCRVPCITAC